MSPSPIQAKKTQKRRILYSDEDEDEEKILGKDSDDDDLPLLSLGISSVNSIEIRVILICV